MNIQFDEFDSTFLGLSGEAQELLQTHIGLKASKNNSQKYITGIRHYLKYKKQRFLSDPNHHVSDMEEVVKKADGSKTTKRILLLSEEDLKDDARIMELMGYDPAKWTLYTCKTRRTVWDVTMKLRTEIEDEDGEKSYIDEPHKETNHAYECVVTCKPLQNKISTDNIQSVFENLQAPELEKYDYKVGDGLLLELPILDVHIGKKAWKEETGAENYDLDIAEEIYKDAVRDILARIKKADWPVEKIVFPVGQDFFHIDTIDNTTTSGTHVDTDGRWVKIYQTGCFLLTWAIEQLRSIAPVDVMYVAGNHDKMLSYFATMHIGAFYRNCKNVDVDISPEKRKYVTWGKCLIGYSHAKMEGNRIKTIMQLESPDWSDVKFREFHLGDLHHEEAKEEGGIIFRRVSAICAADAWHSEKAYSGSIRKAQAFLWDRNKGRQYVVDHNVTE